MPCLIYVQIYAYPPYLREALTWSNPFKLTLFFPSPDAHSHKFSITFSSCWNPHPFFSRPLTSHDAFRRQLEERGTVDDRRHDSNQDSPIPHRRHHQPAHLSPKPTRPPTSQRPPPLRLHQRRSWYAPPPHLTPTPASSIKCSGQFGCAPRRHRQPPLLRLLRLQRLPGPGRDVRRPRHQHVHRR